jgi:hypothetical protein
MTVPREVQEYCMADFKAAKEVELGPHHLAWLQMFHPELLKT